MARPPGPHGPASPAGTDARSPAIRLHPGLPGGLRQHPGEDRRGHRSGLHHRRVPQAHRGHPGHHTVHGEPGGGAPNALGSDPERLRPGGGHLLGRGLCHPESSGPLRGPGHGGRHGGHVHRPGVRDPIDPCRGPSHAGTAGGRGPGGGRHRPDHHLRQPRLPGRVPGRLGLGPIPGGAPPPDPSFRGVLGRSGLGGGRRGPSGNLAILRPHRRSGGVDFEPERGPIRVIRRAGSWSIWDGP